MTYQEIAAACAAANRQLSDFASPTGGGFQITQAQLEELGVTFEASKLGTARPKAQMVAVQSIEGDVLVGYLGTKQVRVNAQYLRQELRSKAQERGVDGNGMAVKVQHTELPDGKLRSSSTNASKEAVYSFSIPSTAQREVDLETKSPFEWTVALAVAQDGTRTFAAIEPATGTQAVMASIEADEAYEARLKAAQRSAALSTANDQKLNQVKGLVEAGLNASEAAAVVFQAQLRQRMAATPVEGVMSED